MQALLETEIYSSQKCIVARISESEFRVSLTDDAIRQFQKETVCYYPHLFNWSSDEEVYMINVVSDKKNAPRLRCPCFTCKHLYPCRRVIAIKGGRIDAEDVHFRYLSDYLNGVYDITRTVSDLTDFQGALFLPADAERHQIVDAGLEAGGAPLEDLSQNDEGSLTDNEMGDNVEDGGPNHAISFGSVLGQVGSSRPQSPKIPFDPKKSAYGQVQELINGTLQQVGPQLLQNVYNLFQNNVAMPISMQVSQLNATAVAAGTGANMGGVRPFSKVNDGQKSTNKRTVPG